MSGNNVQQPDGYNHRDMTHDELMGLIKYHGLFATTENAISGAIKERDTLRAENERLNVELEFQRPYFEEALAQAKKDKEIALSGFDSAVRLNDKLRAENERLISMIEAATGECIVGLPSPDSDNGKLLLANKALARKNEELLHALQSLYDEQNGPPLDKDSEHWYNAMVVAEGILLASQCCLHCGEDRSGKGSLISNYEIYCNEDCYKNHRGNK